ncbi:heme lyase CcmF/NrfE family subunit [Candidatus Odyssella thessalonicensis]|nr:cytochrome c-type biogenesis CcmF C-terminal domain-containing protein [Candidatus Odyssella thessalonicensis]
MPVSWSPYIGQGLLYIAALMAGITVLSPQYKRLLYGATAIISLGAFAWLVFAHLTSDFSFVNVVLHSHTQKPWLYKLSGVWGNHEGSMLLWLLLMLGVGGTAFRRLPQGLSFIAYVALAILLFMIFACNPFTAVLVPPLEGRDLNPLLQDPLLAIHPPVLYLGMVSSLVPVVLMSLHETDKRWLLWTRFSWAFLGIGIMLGSFWAYYELGWGGWWFWDPVENAALVPWLLQTASFHSYYLARQGRLSLGVVKWLSFAVFASCLLGLFIIRSGLVTSVHSFAVGPERGIFLLLVCGVVLFPLGRRLLSLHTNSPSLKQQGINLITALKLGIFLLCFSAFTIAFGTLYPLLLQVFDIQLTVGAPYFNATVVPIMLPTLALMALQPWMTVSGIDKQASLSPLLIATMAVLILGYKFNQTRLLLLLSYGASVWLISSLLLGIKAQRWSWRKAPMLLAHLGVGVAVLGMVLCLAFEEEKLIALKPGQSIEMQGRNFSLASISGIKAENYMGQTAFFTLNQKTVLMPQKRFYWTQGIIHQETSIYSSGLNHYYVSMGDHYQDDAWGFRFAYKPWINLMWLGFVAIGLAGLMSLGRSKEK